LGLYWPVDIPDLVKDSGTDLSTDSVNDSGTDLGMDSITDSIPDLLHDLLHGLSFWGLGLYQPVDLFEVSLCRRGLGSIFDAIVIIFWGEGSDRPTSSVGFEALGKSLSYDVID